MSRYVDAEWLIKESMPLSFSVQKWVNEVQIMTAPSIDIIFCKECEFWKKINSCMSKRSTGYCDEGKRRTHEI